MGSITRDAPMRTRHINSFEDIQKVGQQNAPVVTAFSGGLDSSYLLLMLRQMGYTDIHAVAVDVGGVLDKSLLKTSAAHFGAKFICLDGRAAFVEQGVKPALRAHAQNFAIYPISSSLSRPVIASLAADYAVSVGSVLFLHTANLSQNSLPRLNNSISRSGFSGFFGSPYVHSVIAREKKAKELAAAGLTFMAERKLSGDANLYCEEIEDGPLNNPEDFEIPRGEFTWIGSSDCIKPEKVALGFKRGDLISIDGVEIALIDAVARLNTLVGKFGHGIFVGLEHIFTGESVLEVRAAPAAAIIMKALRHLETSLLSPRALILKQSLEREWVNEAVCGRWKSDVHSICEAGIVCALQGVSGTVTFNVDVTGFQPCSIKAENPFYIKDRGTWELETASAGLLPPQ